MCLNTTLPFFAISTFISSLLSTRWISNLRDKSIMFFLTDQFDSDANDLLGVITIGGNQSI